MVQSFSVFKDLPHHTARFCLFQRRDFAYSNGEILPIPRGSLHLTNKLWIFNCGLRSGIAHFTHSLEPMN